MEAEIKCFDRYNIKRLYGSNPVFIFDPDNEENRPVPGYHDNAILFWSIYPEYIRQLFIKCFTEGINMPTKRPTEREWINAFQRLKKDVVKCPHCGAEIIIETNKEKLCWRCKSLVKKRRKADNYLSQIVGMCPAVLQDRRKLKAYLLDFIPEDRALRNVICLSFDERIPQEISKLESVGRREFSLFKRRLKDSYSLTDEVSEKVVLLWLDALDKKTDFISSIVWEDFHIDNEIRYTKSQYMVMEIGEYCIIDSYAVEALAFLYDKDVFVDKLQYWLENHGNEDCQKKLWAFRYLAIKVFTVEDKRDKRAIEKYLSESNIISRIL